MSTSRNRVSAEEIVIGRLRKDRVDTAQGEICKLKAFKSRSGLLVMSSSCMLSGTANMCSSNAGLV
jgi:hypothetical protein